MIKSLILLEMEVLYLLTISIITVSQGKHGYPQFANSYGLKRDLITFPASHSW